MKNKLIKILSCLLIAILSVCFFVACKTPSGGDKAPSKGLSYKVNGDSKTCTVTGMGTCTDKNLVIPESIDGYTVKSIANSAFAGCSLLTSIVIPDTVTYIGQYAFAGCSNLTSIKYCGTEKQWLAINKGYGWNNAMASDYTITYNYTGE